MFPLSTGSGQVPTPYPNASDQNRHRNVIARLADELDRPEAEITPMYENILIVLRQQARIADYLPILVSKRVRHMLKN